MLCLNILIIGDWMAGRFGIHIWAIKLNWHVHSLRA